MSQHDGTIDDDVGLAFLADLNAFVAAILSNNSGATAPAVTHASMWWHDTANDMLKLRNAADTAWIDVAKFSTFAMPSVQKQLATRCVTAGSGGAYTATTSPNTSGVKLINASINHSTITGASTLAANGDAAKAIKQYDSTGTKVDAILVIGMRAILEEDGTDWILMNPLSGSGSVANNTLYECSTVISADYTLGTGKNALTVGPLTINTGKTLTIPTGARLVVL